MIKKIFGHSALYTLANNIPLLANLIILPIITPFLNREDYGIYGLLFAYLGAFQYLKIWALKLHFRTVILKIK